MKLVLEQLNVTQEEDKAQVKILKKYQEFVPMFREKAYEKLPEHQDQDHKIPKEAGKKPTYSLIYALLKTELKAQQEYLNKNI